MVGLGNPGGEPGISVLTQSTEEQIWWGRVELQIQDPFPKIGSTAIDAGSTPTNALRGGLIMAKKVADGLWYEYDPTKTDGREQARGVLYRGISMLGPAGVVQDKSWQVLSGGLLKASQLNGLDALARIQLSARFIFDDDFPGAGWLGPHLKEISKAGNYTATADDNFSEFVMSAVGDVTLPAIAKGLRFTIRSEVDAITGFISAEGNNIMALDDLLASSVKHATASMMIGSSGLIYTNELGTLWIYKDTSAGTATVTVA